MMSSRLSSNGSGSSGTATQCGSDVPPPPPGGLAAADGSDNAKPMMELVAGVLKNLVFEEAPKLEQKPRTGSLQPLRVDREQVAYLDAVKKQFVVKKDDDFYGPFEMPADTGVN